ncbi:cytochrome c biogenesis protein CcdA [Angustibacter aerolatus]
MLAGLVSFASPCVLPLVPGYLGYVTGLTGVDLEQQRRRSLVAGASLFVLGFTVVFVVTTVVASSAVGIAIKGHADALMRVFGVLVIACGLLFAGWLPGAGRTAKTQWRPRAGLAGAPLLGAVFAIGWTPCIGPTLGSVLLLSSSDTGGAGRGFALGVAYSLGLGVPFVLVALGWSRASRALAVLRRHQRALQLAGAGLLVLLGVLMVTGVWADLSTRMASWAVRVGVAM